MWILLSLDINVWRLVLRYIKISISDYNVTIGNQGWECME
jgi:hypothetical protein